MSSPKASDQTGGVAVDGSVDQVGGDVVGRDKITNYYARDNPVRAGSGTISSATIIAVGNLYGATVLACLMGDDLSIKMLSFVILLALSAAIAVVNFTRQISSKNNLLLISGPITIFLFVFVLGLAFLRPETFYVIWSALLGRSATTPRGPSVGALRE